MSEAKSKRSAVFAASLDPITDGHLWVISRAAELFDELVVAIGRNPSKASKYVFDEDERLSMAKECLKSHSNIRFAQMGSVYLVLFARANGISHIVRGIRNVNDFTVEQTMNNINQKMAGELTSVFLMPPVGLGEVSSSFVKSLIGYEGWRDEVRKYVPLNVAKALEAKFHDK